MDKLSNLVNHVEQFRAQSAGRTKPYPESIKKLSMTLVNEHGVQGIAVACKIPESLIYKWKKQSSKSTSIKYSRVKQKANRVSVVSRGEVQTKSDHSKLTHKSLFKIKHSSGHSVYVRNVEEVVLLLSRLS